MDHLESFIAECDRRTELAKKRLAETQGGDQCRSFCKGMREGGLHLQSSVSKQGWDLSVPRVPFGVDSGCPLPWLLEGREGSRHQAHSLSLCYAHVVKLLDQPSVMNRTWVS